MPSPSYAKMKKHIYNYRAKNLDTINIKRIGYNRKYRMWIMIKKEFLAILRD